METLQLGRRRSDLTGQMVGHVGTPGAAAEAGVVGSVVSSADAGRMTEGPIVRRWRSMLSQVTQIVVAAALLFGGVVYTVMIAPPMSTKASIVGALPGMVIRAPSMGEEAYRVAAVLKRYTKDSSTADRIATAIVEEGRRRNLDPALLVGVLLTEDVTLDTMARSFMGATGLMQVMPFHRGKWGCGSRNLFAVESNICHGASVLEDAVKYAPNVRVALLRYNGCVRGKNTKNCHTYPDKVMRLANRATEQMLAMVAVEPAQISIRQLSSTVGD